MARPRKTVPSASARIAGVAAGSSGVRLVLGEADEDIGRSEAAGEDMARLGCWTSRRRETKVRRANEVRTCEAGTSRSFATIPASKRSIIPGEDRWRERSMPILELARTTI